jgi:hypothetical protein
VRAQKSPEKTQIVEQSWFQTLEGGKGRTDVAAAAASGVVFLVVECTCRRLDARVHALPATPSLRMEAAMLKSCLTLQKDSAEIGGQLEGDHQFWYFRILKVDLRLI